MDRQDSNCGLRLPDDYLDDDDIGDEIVIFDLPKHHPRQTLLRDHGTPESSYDSDTSEISTTSCCNFINCRDTNTVRVPRSRSHTSQSTPPPASIRFNLVSMDKEQGELSNNGTGDCREKDIDTSQEPDVGSSTQQKEETDEISCEQSLDVNNDMSDGTKGDTPEKDLNNHKDDNREKDLSEGVENTAEVDRSCVVNGLVAAGAEISNNIGNREVDSRHNGGRDSNRIEARKNGNIGSNVSVSGVTGGGRKNIVYSFEEIIATLEEKIKSLLKRENYTGVDGRSELKFVRRMTRYNPDMALNNRIVDKIIKFGIAHVFVKVWKSVNSVDFMDYDGYSCAFKNLQTALSVVWNCTDKSAQLCESLVKTHVLLDLLSELGSEKLSGSDLTNENNLYLVKAYLGILHNIVRLCGDSRRTFRSAKAVKVLQWYLNSSNDLVKIKSYLILSYIINEEENDIINAVDDNIQFIVDILKEALLSENHFSKTYAFWALEIVCGLNHLAVNESNKVRIGECGAIPLYIQLLQEGSEEEQVLASGGLWILAFQEENKRLLREDPSSIQVLQRLTVSGASENIRRAARGALWVVKSAKDAPVQESIEDVDMPHIMVSYHHKSSQAMMIKVTRRLRQANYKVWMDLDDMHGSTLEAMALAIERSCVILVCMTQGYKDSPSCRTEAEYTYMQKKEIVPLLLQESYMPDGWLGAFVGARLHFDFSSEERIPMEIQKLIHELGPRGRLPGNRRSHSPAISSTTSRRQDNRSPGASSMDTVTFTAAGSLLSSFSSLHSYHTCRLVSVSTWTAEDIKAWLQSHMLSHLHNRFENFTGELLLQLRKMMVAAPEYYYHTLEVQLSMDLVTSLKFSRILEDISS